MLNPKCWRYDPKDKLDNETCINCHHWDPTKSKCKDHELLKERRYEESAGFRAFDRMMRDNRGVRLE